MDEIREDAAGKGKIGTTRRGIGPAYEDKVGRRSIRVMDLRSEKNLDQRLESVLLHHNAIRKGLGKKIFEKEKLKKDLLKIAPEILKFSQPVWLKIDEFKRQKKKYYLRCSRNFVRCRSWNISICYIIKYSCIKCSNWNWLWTKFNQLCIRNNKSLYNKSR